MDKIIDQVNTKEQNELMEAWKLILADETIGADFKEVSDTFNMVRPALTQKVIEMLVLSFYLGIENARNTEDADNDE